MKKKHYLILIVLFISAIHSFAQEQNSSSRVLSTKLDSCGSCKKKPWLCDLYKKNTMVFSTMPLFSAVSVNGIRRFNYGLALGFGYFFTKSILVEMVHAPYITIDNKYEHMFTLENSLFARKYFGECRTNIFVQAGVGNTLFNYNPVDKYIYMNDKPNSGRVTHDQFYLFPGAGVSFKIKKKYSLDVLANYNFIISNPGRGRVPPVYIKLMFNFHSFKYVKS